MTNFTKDGVLSCQITGAIAEAAIHDLRINRFSFSGFPEINVPDPVDNIFTVTLSFQSHNESIILTRAEAFAAAKKFNVNNGYDPIIFDRIQAALAALEGKMLAS
jgi:hypothetical protein